jgi:hypothetical protein
MVASPVPLRPRGGIMALCGTPELPAREISLRLLQVIPARRNAECHSCRGRAKEGQNYHQNGSTEETSSYPVHSGFILVIANAGTGSARTVGNAGKTGQAGPEQRNIRPAGWSENGIPFN